MPNARRQDSTTPGGRKAGLRIRLGALSVGLFLAVLLVAASAGAAVLTVGPGGTHANIQAAIDAAVATPTGDEIRVRAGTYVENLQVPTSDLGGQLHISGGWNASFTARNPDPASTIVDGGAQRHVFFATISAGSLTLLGLTLQNGLAGDAAAVPPVGAGLNVVVADAEVAISTCRIVSNAVSTSSGILSAGGGGGYIQAGGTASVVIVDSEISGNAVSIDDTTGEAVGGGLVVLAEDSAMIIVSGSSLTGNTMSGGGSQRGAGVIGVASDSALLTIADSHISGNHGTMPIHGAGVDITAGLAGRLFLTRLEITENRMDEDDLNSWQVMLRPGGTSTTKITNSLIARGGSGLASTGNEGTLRATNLTVTDHDNIGVYLDIDAPGVASLANSIIWGNAVADALIGADVSEHSNLVGVDPLFVGAASGNYRLTPSSPAVDAGSAAPPGGLSTKDLDGGPRTVGPLPDQGAYEQSLLFADGFESGGTTAWSSTVP